MAETLIAFVVDQQRRNLSAETVGRRRRVLRAFSQWAGVEPEDASRDQVVAWLDSCNIGARSRYMYLSSLHCFYEFLQREGIRLDDPTLTILRPRLPRLVPRPIIEADLAVALASADRRMRAWLALMSLQGFRCIDVASLRREDVLETREPPVIVTSNSKGGRQDVLPLNEYAEYALRDYGLPRSGWVFRMESGRPYRPGTVSTYVSRFLHGLGIEATAHQARHLFVTKVWQMSKDMRVTQEMARHASVTTTGGYAQYDNALAFDVVRNLSVAGFDPAQASLFA